MSNTDNRRNRKANSAVKPDAGILTLTAGQFDGCEENCTEVYEGAWLLDAARYKRILRAVHGCNIHVWDDFSCGGHGCLIETDARNTLPMELIDVPSDEAIEFYEKMTGNSIADGEASCEFLQEVIGELNKVDPDWASASYDSDVDEEIFGPAKKQ